MLGKSKSKSGMEKILLFSWRHLQVLFITHNCVIKRSRNKPAVIPAMMKSELKRNAGINTMARMYDKNRLVNSVRIKLLVRAL